MLDGIALDKGRGAEPRGAGPASARDEWLLRRVTEALRRGEGVVDLGERDLRALEPPSPTTLPPVLAALVTVCAASREAVASGDVQLTVDVSLPSAAVLLGRFCHGDPGLREALERHLRVEEALAPGAVFAEIVHMPEGRLGNILCRPVLREHEIAYLGRSGAAPGKTIDIEDLWVRVEGERFHLFSERLGCEVVPRMSTAHNHGASTLGVYRFLCAVQVDEQRHAFGFGSEALEQLPTLPRITSGRLVLSLARFRLDRDEIVALRKAETPVARLRAVRALRERRGIPRHMCLVQGDNVLPLDLESAFGVENLVGSLGQAQAAVLREPFPAADELVAEGPEGRFVHELVVPFVAERPPAPARAPLVRPRVVRSFPPGSEWLFAKIYAGTHGVEALLDEVVEPLVRDALAEGAADSWFFLRYGDPDWHLRLRFHGDPAALLVGVLPRLRDAIEPRLADGRVGRLALDTYVREIERYGGDLGIELVEGLFFADSEAALRLVAASPGDEGADARWRFALLGMHTLLEDLGLGLDERISLLTRTRAGFAEEHGVDVAIGRQLGARFRAERASLEELLDGRVEGPLEDGLVALAERRAANAKAIAELAERAMRGELTASIAGLAASLLHMHANRVLTSEHRAQELVLYDFLLRLYESRAARSRRRASP